MKILITGVCGFVGETLARRWLAAEEGIEIIGIDNLSRPGSERNRMSLRALGVKVVHGDIRNASDLESLDPVDWVIDAAANPSVLAGVDGRSSSRQLVEHNLFGTVNLLEFCKRTGAGWILLSTSRVYSIEALAALPVRSEGSAFALDSAAALPSGVSAEGVSEQFSTAAPVSLYGATKLCSEALALEYGQSFGFPVWINRCGILAGAGQFGRADQGIIAFWLHSWRSGQPLRYIGFQGQGHQVRDCLHPADLVPLLRKQTAANPGGYPSVVNVSGGRESSFSLRQLSDWCESRWGARTVSASPEQRPFDIPWVILDSSQARKAWSWSPQICRDQIFEEIARHAEDHPDWLAISAPSML